MSNVFDDEVDQQVDNIMASDGHKVRKCKICGETESATVDMHTIVGFRNGRCTKLMDVCQTCACKDGWPVKTKNRGS